MIVPSMTPQEVYREIDYDIPRLHAWRERTHKFVAKRAKQMLKFPQTIWYDHESPRRNRYLFASILLSGNYWKKSIDMGVALQKMERGWAVYYVGWPDQEKFNKIAILPHAFDRYAERGNVQKTGIELIKHFMCHNTTATSIHDNRFSGRSVRYQDRENMCVSIHDGVLLGENIGDIFVARTFITYDMATGLQSEAFAQKRNNLMSKEEQVRQMQRDDRASDLREQFELERIAALWR